ncbi:MAG TPA: type IV pilus modification protein PilV [Rhodocyclaceae bacterium]
MTRLRAPSLRFGQQGVSLLEVLITMLILSFGLLGLAGLQARAMTAEMESYQRGQAIVMLQDMVDRMSSNSGNAASYETGATPMGTGATDAADCTTLGTRAAKDLCEWSKAIKGSSENKSGSKVGAMIDGRGCVEAGGVSNVFVISVVWKGKTATVAPSSTCGQGDYGDDTTRRIVTTTLTIPNLSAN